MKISVAALFLVSATTSATIIFPYIQPTCDLLTNPDACLRSQLCTTDNTCIPVDCVAKRQNGEVPARLDGRCGREFDNATCDSEGPYGGCCSSQGWCGNTPEHCLNSAGCQSGCDSQETGPTASVTTSPPDATSDAPLSEPVLGPGTSTASAAARTGSATTDGTCGAGNRGTICGDWHLGGCCSMYGFCGDTSAHCGQGCQSGPCFQAPEVPAPALSPAPANTNAGSFAVVGDSGVPAMHAALMPNGRVVFLDKVEDYTHLMVSGEQYAYSSEYNPVANTAVPLTYKTNAFCSGGSFLADGTLVNVGGNAPLKWLDPTIGDGFRGLRYLSRSLEGASQDGSSWEEPGNLLNTARWYASVQTMPDGTLFVASGSLNGLTPAKPKNNNPTYEVVDAQGQTQGESIPMSLLKKAQPYYMYPFIHLLRDGTLFIFTSKNSEIFNVANNETVKQLPELSDDYRTYPNTGGSVLLPLSSENDWNPDIVICGGGAYQDITSPTDPSCGRIRPLDDGAAWEMDSMPEGRGMVEGILLPDGTVLWVNGAQKGAQGFELAENPAYEALIYDPATPLGQRWTRGASSDIPRLYHSVALLLLDGTLLIAGSNPFEMPVQEPSATSSFITDFRVEIYTPPYLSGANADRRPTDVVLSAISLSPNSETFTVTFAAPEDAQGVKIALYHGGFVTHSVHMSHRMLFLDSEGWVAGARQQKLIVTTPPNTNVAPPGPYVVYVVVDGVPSTGRFVMVA
ncbi:hypothetical protein LTR37_009381 [Vermiconidia calcicola]|uniref:Uncharacterized protein n=1 Tax=Vermiconidia calcicola TaxID=1690605 RepID=A0ACC3N834_9PEZI|nr:hypothetical protein LTR37_009381 [Vermiconidia calcicola]